MGAFDDVLSRQRVKLRAEWLRGTLAAFGPGGEAWQQAAPQQLDAYLFDQLLRSDLAASVAAPGLPDPLVGGRLPGPVLLQISRAVNVTRPRHESMLECAPDKRTLKLQLTDGHRNVAAFELEPVPQLSISDFGVKVLLRNVQVRGSMLLLQPENVYVLGGEMPSARAEYEAALRITQEEITKAGMKRRIEEKENPGRAQPRRTMVTQQPPMQQQQQQQQQQADTVAARRVSQIAQFNTGAVPASPVRHGCDEPDVHAGSGPASTAVSASASAARTSAASSTTVQPTASSPVTSPVSAEKPAAELSAHSVANSDRRWSRTEQLSTSLQQQQAPPQQPPPPLQQHDNVRQSTHSGQLPRTLSAVLRRWKEQPDAPMLARGVVAKVVTIKKSTDAPQGLVWKGFTQYSCKVVLASPDMETKAEVFLSDGVIEGFVARGTTCVELNRRLEAARNSTNAEKASLQQFFKSFPARFAQMHGRFDIQWPGACGEQRHGQADAAAIDAGQPTTYGTVVAFEQQATPSQQSG